MNLLTEPLAAKQGVRVNAVAAGYVGTELTLKGRSKEEWFGTWMRRTPIGGWASPARSPMPFSFRPTPVYITGTVLTFDGR